MTKKLLSARFGFANLPEFVNLPEAALKIFRPLFAKKEWATMDFSIFSE